MNSVEQWQRIVADLERHNASEAAQELAQKSLERAKEAQDRLGES